MASLVTLFACPAIAHAAFIPGTGAPRNDERVTGDYVVWTRPAHDQASCGNTYRPIPERSFVLDLRNLQVRAAPRMVDDGYLQITALDHDGVAVARLVRCSGDDRFGRLDLSTLTFTDYALLAESRPLPVLRPGCPGCGQSGGVPPTYGFDFDHVVDGEAIEIREGTLDPETVDVLSWRLTRVDLRSGRTRTIVLDRRVIDDLDTLLRARNGDLVWVSAQRQSPQFGDACAKPPLVRVWSYATGSMRTVRPGRGGWLPARAIARSGSGCHGVLDPDSLTLYHPTRRDDDVSWQLRGCVGPVRISLCGAPRNAYGRTAPCCLRLHDTRSNTTRAVPGSSGGRRYPVALGHDHVVWGRLGGGSSSGPSGPLFATPLASLRQMSEVTSVRRSGSRVTIGWRTFGTRYNTRIVARTPGRSWGAPRIVPITGVRVGGRCRGPYRIRATGSWNSRTLCTPRLPQRRGSVTFIDAPGRQVYLVDGGGYYSRPVVR